jgi:hypothetical protein
VLGHVQGEKIRIGKYRRRTGYRRHTGHRSKLTQVQIESIGPKRSAAKKEEEAAAEKPKRTRSATTSSRTRATKTKETT